MVQWKDITPLAAQVRDGTEGKHFVSGLFFYFGGCSEAAMGGGGAQRPVWHGNEPKKMGARSARARTRGQNTLVNYKRFQRQSFLCVGAGGGLYETV